MQRTSPPRTLLVEALGRTLQLPTPYSFTAAQSRDMRNGSKDEFLRLSFFFLSTISLL